MSADLERGRECYRRRAWTEAYRSLSLADQAAPLGAADLELLAVSAYLIGHDDQYLEVLHRAHRAYLAQEQPLRAVRCAFWLAARLLFRGEIGRTSGWLARAQKLLDREDHECVEHGYLLLPIAQQLAFARDWDAAYTTAARAADIGDRFRERDVSACARHLQGLVRMQQGPVAEGLTLLDEAMLAVTAGELSPLMTGFIFARAVDGCLQMYAFGRAREWTAAFARWCSDQPDVVAFTGACMVNRAQVLQLQGAWPDALQEAQRACKHCLQTASRQTGASRQQGEVHPRGAGSGTARRRAAAAFYQQAEIHRLRGDFAAAEEAYRSASEWGWEPQPGLALLRVAEGRIDAASAAMRRARGATADPLERARLLPAYVEIMLAADKVHEARDASRELDEIAQRLDTEIFGAIAAHARGAVELAEGDARAALGSLRRAWHVWQQFGAPYAAARVRLLIALACQALGDQDGYELERGAARTVFQNLGAAPDLARMDAFTGSPPSGKRSGLTSREVQVLRLVASGKTNRAVAAELFVSEKTIDRHVSNIFSKLNVASRTAATAYAYEHKLI